MVPAWSGRLCSSVHGNFDFYSLLTFGCDFFTQETLAASQSATSYQVKLKLETKTENERIVLPPQSGTVAHQGLTLKLSPLGFFNRARKWVTEGGRKKERTATHNSPLTLFCCWRSQCWACCCLSPLFYALYWVWSFVFSFFSFFFNVWLVIFIMKGQSTFLLEFECCPHFSPNVITSANIFITNYDKIL